MPDVNGEEIVKQEDLAPETGAEVTTKPEVLDDPEKDEKGVPWKNRAIEARRKLEKAQGLAEEYRANYEQLEAALKDRPEILRALLEGTPLPTAQPGQVDDGLDPETRALLDRPKDLLVSLAKEVRTLKQATLAAQHVQVQGQEQAAWQQFHWAIAHFMNESGFDPQDERRRTRISDLVVAECNRRRDTRNPVQGAAELREVFQGVLDDLGMQPPKGAKPQPSPRVPPSTTRGGGPTQHAPAEANFADPNVTRSMLARLLREAEGVPLE